MAVREQTCWDSTDCLGEERRRNGWSQSILNNSGLCSSSPARFHIIQSAPRRSGRIRVFHTAEWRDVKKELYLETNVDSRWRPRSLQLLPTTVHQFQLRVLPAESPCYECTEIRSRAPPKLCLRFFLGARRPTSCPR